MLPPADGVAVGAAGTGVEVAALPQFTGTVAVEVLPLVVDRDRHGRGAGGRRGEGAGRNTVGHRGRGGGLKVPPPLEVKVTVAPATNWPAWFFTVAKRKTA